MKHRTISWPKSVRDTNQSDHGSQKYDESLERLRDQVRQLETKQSELRGILSVLGLILTIVSALGGWRLYESSKFEAARRDVYANLVSHLRARTSDAINKLTLAEGPQDQKMRIHDISNLNQSLANLRIADEQLSNTGELVRALHYLVIENKREPALDIVDSLVNNPFTDPFIRARAITLQQLILISDNRTNPPATARKHLLEAIKLDSTVALAFNGLGIISTADALKKLHDGDAKGAMRLMDEAAIEYQMAANLDASALGTYREVNNRIWSLLLITKWCLERPEQRSELEAYLRGKGFENLNEFFEKAQGQLQQYEPLAPDMPIALETTAQIMFVHALSLRLNSNEQEANAMLKQGYDTFLRAIDSGLYRRVAKDSAKGQFDSDYLHTEISLNPQYSDLKQKIHERIDDWYTKNAR